MTIVAQKVVDGTCTVYALAASDNAEVRYVGQTIQPLHARLSGHIARSKRGALGHLHAWIRSIIARGKSIRIFALEESAAWNTSEERWIADLRSRGVRLLNCTAGGRARRGYSLNEATRIRLREIATGQWKDPEFRQRVLSGHAAFWTDERRAAQASRAMAQGPKSDSARAQTSASLRRHYEDPNARASRRVILERVRSDPDNERRRIEASREATRRLEYRERHRTRMAEIWRLRREGLLPMPRRDGAAC